MIILIAQTSASRVSFTIHFSRKDLFSSIIDVCRDDNVVAKYAISSKTRYSRESTGRGRSNSSNGGGKPQPQEKKKNEEEKR